MANRKVLINRHTSGSSAPNAAEMYKGEIAVAHETGKETLFTKNNAGDMVPFISCAQTIAIIDSKVQASEDVVKAKDGEAHLEVKSGGTTGATEWILNTKDVQSEEEFKAYSARTNNALTALTKSFADLLDVTLTAGTGDDIITVTSASTDVSTNTFSVTHKTATAVTGFNKLDTDAYGHVTAATPVAASDIKALGFEDSAWTEEAITDAINALDSAIAATDGKYITGIAIANGTFSGFTEADLPKLASAVTGDGNVVTDIAVDDHTITFTKGITVAADEDLQALSGSVISFSAETVAEFSSAFTAIKNLSADTAAADDEVFASAKTYSDELIAALDSSKTAADNKHYITAITIENGKLSTIGEAEIPVLASAVTGTGNVVTDIAVNDHTITFAKDLAVASEDDLKAVSGIVDTFSAATVAEFNSAFTAIQAMDKAADAVAGQVVTTVSEVDGVVSETKANVKDLQLGGYSKDTTATGDIASDDTINAALSKLENKAAAITIANADKSINVTTGATGTDINVNIKSSEKVLAKDGAAGLYTDIKLSGVTPSSTTVKEEYALYATDGSILGDHIKIYKDSSLVSITLENNDGSGHTGQYLKYTYIDASGDTQSTYVDVSAFLVEAEFASGVTADQSGIVHGVVDSTSEKDSNNDSFLTVGADGFKVDGIKDEIDAKIAALDVTDDAAVAGQYVAAIEETDGVVAVKSRANVSEAVLNNYAKGSDATAVAATDTVNQAIGKLENQIDAAKAAATTKVVEGTDAGNNMTITSAAGADNSVTYTVNLVDIASSTALTAEIAARKAVDGQNGDIYAANAGTNFISDATSLNDADVKLDAAIKALSGDTDAAIKALDSVGSASTTGHYLTSVTITDGKITAVGEVAVPANVAITATTATPVDTPSAVLTGVTADGADNHNLTFGMSNKVFSASTADIAQSLSGSAQITSAQVSDIVVGIENTKVHEAESADTAASADKVANALSISGYATSESSALDTTINYDGSQAKSLTFGTNTTAGKSMSMTSAGVVDVEIIDCGEY